MNSLLLSFVFELSINLFDIVLQLDIIAL